MTACSPVATLRKLRRFNGWFDGFSPEADSDPSAAVDQRERVSPGRERLGRVRARVHPCPSPPGRADAARRFLRADVQSLRRSNGAVGRGAH